jgi:hypothetical protein
MLTGGMPRVVENKYVLASSYISVKLPRKWEVSRDVARGSVRQWGVKIEHDHLPRHHRHPERQH